MRTRNTPPSRREILHQLAGGMALTALGSDLTLRAGFALPRLDEEGALDFGPLADLVELQSQTALEDLQPALVAALKSGRSLSELVAAGALANARAFAGEDYEGYHAFMALMPAYEMAREMPLGHEALPVLKVLYRGAARMHAYLAGGASVVLAHPEPTALPAAPAGQLLAELHALDKAGAESTFDAILRERRAAAFEALIPVVCQEEDVHRVVLAWRAQDLLRLTGEEHARLLLRQSIRQCIEREAGNQQDPIRSEIPAVLEESGVLRAEPGTQRMDDEWVARSGRAIVNATRRDGAALVAEAIRAGVDGASIGAALAFGCTDLMLRQPPRTKAAEMGRGVGSVHGAGTGIHSADTAAAWRGMASFGSTQQKHLALVAAGYHAAGQSGYVNGERLDYTEASEHLGTREASDLLGVLREGLAGNDQLLTCAAVHRYVQQGHALRPVLDVLLASSVAADGALHAEKYYRTQVEVLERDRAAHRTDHAAALARVCASQHGYLAAGYEQALALLG